MTRLTARALVALSIAVVAWGALAFGAVYPWAFTPLACAAGATGLTSLVILRRARPPLGALTIGLACIGVAIAIQLVPLSQPTLARISPAADAFLRRNDFTYQLGGTHPLSIAPEKTAIGGLLFAAFALFLLGTTRLLSLVSARKVRDPLIALGLLLAFVGLAQAATISWDFPLIYGFWKPQAETGAHPFGPFVNPNHFAGWMLLALPLTLTAAVDALVRALRTAPIRVAHGVEWISSPQVGRLLATAGAFLVMGLSLLMTRSRAGLAAFAVAGLLLATVVARRQTTRRARTLVVGVTVLLLAATAAWAGVDVMTSKFTETKSQGSYAARLQAWTDTRHIVQDFALIGTGLDTYGTAMMQYQSNQQLAHFQEAHNDYLQIAAEGGLLLGVPVLFTLGVFVRDVRRRFREAPKDGTTYWLRVGAVAGLVSMALQSVVEFSLQMPGNAVLFTLLAAIALHQSPNLTFASAPDRESSHDAHGRRQSSDPVLP